MIILLVKLIFLLNGLYATHELESQFVITFLIAVTISALLQYLKSANATAVGLGLFAVVCFAEPMGIYFLPVIIIDLCLSAVNKKYYFLLLLPMFVALNEGYIAWLILNLVLAFLAGYMLRKNKYLLVAYNALQDSHTEQSLVLRQKNSELMETQGKIANYATMQERTRIARDIHDNIGHILIRGILMVGVLKTTNKAENLTQHITDIESVLKEAMDSIRKAVHDWKDESVDLFETIEKLSAATPLSIDLQYDVSENIPTEIKLCFLMVIKEAITNASKHSNATSMRITLQEHPSMYQLLIKDNGEGKIGGKTGHGMGLSNIEERVAALKGSCNFEKQNGFRIFISITKGG